LKTTGHFCKWLFFDRLKCEQIRLGVYGEA